MIRWYKTKNKLPEKDQRVIICIKDEIFAATACDSSSGGIGFSFLDYNSICSTDRVDAWADMPELPQWVKQKE